MIILVLAVGASAAGAFVWAESFHTGGVGACGGCHVIHKTQSGPTQMLLQAGDPSSICLNCHAGTGGQNNYSVFSPDGSALTPGGDFYWLTKSYSWVGGQSPGSSHGHSIVARDFGLVPDPLHLQSAGGTYPAAQLGCTSCHDPHGQAGGGTPGGGPAVSGSGSYGDTPAPGTVNGNYRLLGGAGYNAGGSSLNYLFTNDAPVARQSSVNRYAESDLSHVDYGSGMSEWCANCHGPYHEGSGMGGPANFRHPTDRQLSQAKVNNYNTYVRSGDFSGIAATAYLQFVPFEQGETDPSLLDPNSTQGPDNNSRVMCLTCHRAHGSAFENSGRWDFKAALLAQSHPALGDAGAAANDAYYSYYGRDIAAEFGSGQGRFCEKCHGTTGMGNP